MPTDSPQNNSNDIFITVIEGKYTKLPSKADFQEILNQILMDSECDESQQKNQQLFNFKCATPVAKNSFIHYVLLANLKSGKLNNIFDFFSKYIITNKNILSGKDIKNLISLGTHYAILFDAKINDANSTFVENDIVTSSSFLNFLTSLLNIHSITEFETPGLIYTKGKLLPNITFGDPQRITTLIGDTIKLSEDLTHILEYKKETLFDFLENLGRFGFELKIKEDFQDYSHKILEIANKTIWSTNLINFSKEDRELAGRSFLFGFDDNNENQIKSDCVDLLGLEDCPPLVTPNTLLFRQIAQGKYPNLNPSFADFEKVESEIKVNIYSLDRNQYIHVLTFLKNVLKTNNGVENLYNFKNLFTFAFNSINNLKNDLQQKNRLDDSFSLAAESLSFFLFNIVKNNVNNQDLLDQIHIITQFNKLYQAIIIHAPHLNSLLETMSNHLFSILARNIDSASALQTGYSDFINIIKDLNKVCKENRDACNISKILAGSFKSLGSISRKSSGYNLNATLEAKALIELTKGNINSEQLRNAVSFFFKANISQIVLNRKCKEIFNLTGCRPANLINLDDQPYSEIDEIAVTTLLPEVLVDTNSTTTAPQIITNTTIAPVINQTSNDPVLPTALVFPEYPTSETISTTEIIKDLMQKAGSRIPSPTEISLTVIHTLFSSLLNVLVHAIPDWLTRNGYIKSKTADVSLRVAGGILHALCDASFLLMLTKLNALVAEGNEEQAQTLWEKMTAMLPVVLINLGMRPGLQLLNYLCEKILYKIPNVKDAAQALIQSTPTLVSLFNFKQNPILFGIRAGVGYLASSAGLFGLNRYFAVKNQHVDVEVANEQNGHEMQQLNEAKDIHPTANDTATTALVISKKIPFFITEEQFNQIKNKSEKILNELAELVCSLAQIIENNRAEIKRHIIPVVANTYQKIIDDKSKVHSDLQGIFELKLYPTSTKSIWKEIMEFLNDDHKDAHIEFVIKNIYTLDEIENVLQKVYKKSATLELPSQPEIKHSFVKFTSEIKTINDYINSSQNRKNSSSNSDLIFTTNEKNIIQAMEKLIQQTSISAIEKLGNVFKLLVPKFSDMKLTLSTTLGFVQGANSSFTDGDTLDKLTTVSEDIQSLLSSTGIYLSKYNTFDAGNQGEQKGKILACTEFFEKIALNTTANTLRLKKTRTFLDNRCKSMASDSDTRTLSSGSEEGSVISTGSSKDEENAQIVRPLLKSSM